MKINKFYSTHQSQSTISAAKLATVKPSLWDRIKNIFTCSCLSAPEAFEPISSSSRARKYNFYDSEIRPDYTYDDLIVCAYAEKGIHI